jgi:hypothetical protein
MAIVSRRSTRYCAESDGAMMEDAGAEHRPSSGSSSDENERDRPQRDARTSSTNIELGMIPMVDLGKDLAGLFPKTIEDMGKHGMHFLMRPSSGSRCSDPLANTPQSRKVSKQRKHLRSRRLMADHSISGLFFLELSIAAVSLRLKTFNFLVLLD